MVREVPDDICPIGMMTDEVCTGCGGFMYATNNQDYVYCHRCQRSQLRSDCR